MPMHPLETYLRAIKKIRGSNEAQAELSYYPAMERLLNDVGDGLKPSVTCILAIKDRGADHPDAGLFTPDQLLGWQNSSDEDVLGERRPSRGVVEVKSPAEEVRRTAKSKQVAKYWRKYGQVLVTNYREFVIVGTDADGNMVTREGFALAPTEAAFWDLTTNPRRSADERGDRLVAYLGRAMEQTAPLTAPEDVAAALAAYAREAQRRIEQVEGLPALASIRAALEQALGLKFEGKKGEHFFRSTLVQTLFYGVFSAWILWGRQRVRDGGRGRFDWERSAKHLRVPILRKLFHEVTDPANLDQLGIAETLDWANEALNRVLLGAFFDRVKAEDAIQYFYEPFLQEFDPALRKELGVWYTPREVVQYMVARVDNALREELGLEDGLANPNVYVLDPCCGTGAFPVEVLRRIAATLRERGDDGLLAADIKRIACERVFGFEIMPAPFVVSHLQLGILLQDLGAPLSETKDERVGVYLTNALTGWEPAQGPKLPLVFHELEEERDAAERVKRDTPILVVLGNPPYNGFAGVAVDEERDLSNAYRATTRTVAPSGRGLNDLYVRFFRMAERRIAGNTGKGVICFISNYSWLDGQSFPGMREQYLDAFDSITIDNLNGDKYRTGKITPTGDPDPSIFSTAHNREGIQVGTAIALLVRRGDHEPTSEVLYRDLWGRDKTAQLLASAEGDTGHLYRPVEPPIELGFPFVPGAVSADYFAWPSIAQLFPVAFPGMYTARDDVLLDIDRDRLVERMHLYFDPSVTDATIAARIPSAMRTGKRFDAPAIRQRLVQRGMLPDNIIPYAYRPFDIRWLYWEPETKLLDEKRADYVPHVIKGNRWLATQQRARRGWTNPQVLESVGSLHLVESGTTCMPMRINAEALAPSLFGEHEEGNGTGAPSGGRFNLSDAARAYLRSLGLPDSGDLFHHVLAILHAPAFAREHGDSLGKDWARVPLPSTADALSASAVLGARLAALLDVEAAVAGVTTGAIKAELRPIGVIVRQDGKSVNPGTDLGITARWGVAGRASTTMPGPGKLVRRDYTAAEMTALTSGTGLTEALVRDHLGADVIDIFLNDVAYWSGVPAKVWEFELGGYQVLKKWLSYRERDLLGRDLTTEEARQVTAMIRRAASVLLMAGVLDDNYRAVERGAFAWPQAAGR